MSKLRKLVLAVVAAVFLLADFAPVAAVAQQMSTASDAADTQAVIDRWNADLERIDMALDRVGTSDFDLRNMRDQTIDIVSRANSFASQLAPQVAAAGAQVKELSPVQGADSAVSDAIKDDLAAAQKLFADLSGSQQQAQAIAVHGTYTTSQINERRRRLFTSRLLEQSASLVDPTLWQDAAAELPNVSARTSDLIGNWYQVLTSRDDRSTIALVLAVIAGMVIVVVPGRSMLLRRLAKRLPPGPPADGRTRVLAATTTVALNTLVPTGVLIGGHAILGALDLSTDRIDQLWWGITSAVALFSLGFGVSRALLAPSRPDMRLVDLEDAIALRVFRLTVAVAAMQGLSVFIERFARIAYTGLPLVVAVEGVLSSVSAILIILVVRTLNRRPIPDEAEEEDPSAEEPILRRVGFVAAGFMGAAALVADLMGYIALGRFITAQIAWITTVVALLVLLIMLADELTAAWFRREGVVGSRLIASIGFAPRSLTQVGVLFNGLVRALLVGAAVLVVVAPWGVDSTSVFESVRQVFFGFKVGSISISFSAIIAGIAVFGIGVVITRALQGWLDTRFLPTTRLDSGLRNSIRTSVGYLGTIAAAAIAFGYSGIDLSSIAIVAGALSVGIGLGLQAIVNNFVSGLILLAERPIRAGDWIAVGTEEGVVKRINVRATEIETFDRATLIVPNSTLITGQVKNLVLRDRSGRAIVPISVAKTSDPGKVREILLATAKAHPLVLAYPEPNVLFMAFNNVSLDFELRVYLSDIGQGLQVRSDLRFEALSRFRAEGIDLP